MVKNLVQVGMVVGFQQGDGFRRAGEVVKMNRKTAEVDAGYQIFTVFYSEMFIPKSEVATV